MARSIRRNNRNRNSKKNKKRTYRRRKRRFSSKIRMIGGTPGTAAGTAGTAGKAAAVTAATETEEEKATAAKAKAKAKAEAEAEKAKAEAEAEAEKEKKKNKIMRIYDNLGNKITLKYEDDKYIIELKLSYIKNHLPTSNATRIEGKSDVVVFNYFSTKYKISKLEALNQKLCQEKKILNNHINNPTYFESFYLGVFNDKNYSINSDTGSFNIEINNNNNDKLNIGFYITILFYIYDIFIELEKSIDNFFEICFYYDQKPNKKSKSKNKIKNQTEEIKKILPQILGNIFSQGDNIQNYIGEFSNNNKDIFKRYSIKFKNDKAKSHVNYEVTFPKTK